jgi:Major Facilitator Superfamily
VEGDAVVDEAESRFDRRILLRARVAVSGVFITFGLVIGTWLAHIPVVATRLHLEPALLGLALLAAGIGAVIAQPIAGLVIARLGSRSATTIFIVALAASLPLPIIAWVTPALFAGTFLLGLAGGSANVAMNTQASEVETARGRPTMSFFHGLFSVGFFAGASLGGLIVVVGWGGGSGAALVAVVLIIAGVAVGTALLPTTPLKNVPTENKGRRFVLPTTAVLGFAGLALIANTVEGSVGDWSALYLSTIRHLSEGTAASGLVMFSFAQAICRLGGGPVVARLGEKAIVAGGGLLMATGMGIVVLSPWSLFSPFGFALVAIGNANIAPVLYGAASRAPGIVPSVGIAAVATAQTVGFLAGPPIIGFLAQAFGLSTALGFLMVGGVAIAAGATFRRWRPLGFA